MVCHLYFQQVKYWITFNEPWVVTWQGYGTGEYAPGIKQPATLPYLYGHNIIKSHAEAWHLYDTKYRSQFNGNLKNVYCALKLTLD